jgi:hypothetical protein
LAERRTHVVDKSGLLRQRRIQRTDRAYMSVSSEKIKWAIRKQDYKSAN